MAAAKSDQGSDAQVRYNYTDGMAVEDGLTQSLRDQYKREGIVIRETARSTEPHAHEDIKDIPSVPDLEIFIRTCDLSEPLKVWVTHKMMKKYLMFFFMDQFLVIHEDDN